MFLFKKQIAGCISYLLENYMEYVMKDDVIRVDLVQEEVRKITKTTSLELNVENLRFLFNHDFLILKLYDVMEKELSNAQRFFIWKPDDIKTCVRLHHPLLDNDVRMYFINAMSEARVRVLLLHQVKGFYSWLDKMFLSGITILLFALCFTLFLSMTFFSCTAIAFMILSCLAIINRIDIKRISNKLHEACNEVSQQ